MARNIDWRLYLVLDTAALDDRDPLAITRAALAGGVTVVQLRAKGRTAREQVALGQSLLHVTEEYNTPLLINDHADIALAIGAAGVHLGVDDLPVALARQIMPDGLIGYSPEDVADARRAVAGGADYLGVGPFAATRTKADAGAAIGASGLQSVVNAVSIPVVAIGGLTAANAADAIAAGAASIAVASAIIAAPDPGAVAHELSACISEALKERALGSGYNPTHQQ